MKRFLTFVLALIMIFVLCACDKGGQTPVVTEEPQPAPTETTVVETSTVKAGLITLHDENSTYDKNFITGFTAACDKLGVEYLIKTGVGENNEAYDAACELVDEGCNFVFADSFGHEDYMIQAALEFPEVQFCHATGTKAHIEGIANYHNAFASIYEGRYLAGVALGMKLAEMVAADGVEPIVGYVGAYSYAEVISGYTSFFLGVRSVVPEAKMVVSFTGSWYDETAEKEAAITLMNNGCVVISAHADSMGMPTACEQNGVPFVGYNGSFKEACPNTYITSTRINWEPYFEFVINAIRNNETIPADWTGTIATGSVEMCELNDAVAAAGTADKLAEVTAAFNSNSLKVFDTSVFTFEGETLDSYMADVDTDDSYTPDTEVVKGGYFHESEYRSAPYFDLSIDGISLLNTAF